MTAAGYAPRARVLCVDDEPNVLAALSRTLQPFHDVVTATGAAAAIARLERGEAFHVVVSDLKMPEMDGVAFFGRVRQLSPDSVRVLLTGNADLSGAIAAVNEGQVFRFLVKPCASDALLRALAAAVEQHRLITAERVLLEQTVHGSIKALTDLLAIAQPASFGRATRLKRHAEALATALDVPDRWQIEVAALLSQVGYIAIPPEVALRVQKGQPLSREEQELVNRLPQLAEGLLASIPRLEGVRAILTHQSERFLGPTGASNAARLPIGSRLLRVAHDFDVLEAQGTPPALAVAVLEGRTGEYDPDVLAALRRLVVGESERPAARIEEIRLADVEVGMSFAADVVAANGLLLVARGQDVTQSLLHRIRSSWSDFATKLRVRVVVTAPAPAPAVVERVA
jgi:response regulator RpfG family c-di-GMP phosphodiesterase